MMGGRKLFFVLFCFGFFFQSLSLFSARFPNSVQKTITVTEKTALEWAQVLGLKLNEKKTMNFVLHPMEVHAISLMPNTVLPVTVPTNLLNFDPEKQTLTLAGNWLDQLTGSAESKKPRYTFGSGFIREDLSGAGDWGDLLRSMGFPRTSTTSKKHGDLLEKRSSAKNWFPWTEKLPWLEVKVYQLESFNEADKTHPWGYQVVIGVEE